MRSLVRVPRDWCSSDRRACLFRDSVDSRNERRRAAADPFSRCRLISNLFHVHRSYRHLLLRRAFTGIVIAQNRCRLHNY